MQSPALQGILNHWTTREVPVNIIIILGTPWPIASVSLDSHVGHGDMGPEIVVVNIVVLFPGTNTPS